MRVGLIADTHIPECGIGLWPEVYDAFRGADAILHAGDVYDLSVIDALGAIAPIWVARGNGDDGSGGRAVQPDDPRLRRAWTLELGGLRVGLVHDLPIPSYGGYTLERAMNRHFDRTDFDVLVYGDTHVEAVSHVDRILCVNPGSPTLPHSLTARRGTIGMLDIADGRADATIWQILPGGIEPFRFGL